MDAEKRGSGESQETETKETITAAISLPPPSKSETPNGTGSYAHTARLKLPITALLTLCFERRRRSRIDRLVTENGDVVEKERDILSFVSNFYSNLFTSAAGNGTEELLQNVHAKVSNEMNRGLLKPFTEEEIKAGLEAIDDLKAPGADDNILIAYELTHYPQNKRCGKEGFAALKLDMSKAYDRVEWDFLARMMTKLGFHERWVSLIMKCVSTVSYRVRVNEEHGRIQEVSICDSAPSINHLLFADDSLLLLKVNQGNADHLKYVLQLYEECSGQIINKEKSSVLFSKNCGEATKEEFLAALDLSHEAKNDKYLGLPVYMGRSKAKMFTYLKDRILVGAARQWKEDALDILANIG
ncbi:uncharacterized protein [Miscanthus floridulus]|uniref:uncharacterized protein n=1 Tax=Miscanthus floridulus TaxID=154761 RepID=UPI0034584ADD